jgi:hypothetical protein
LARRLVRVGLADALTAGEVSCEYFAFLVIIFPQIFNTHIIFILNSADYIVIKLRSAQARIRISAEKTNLSLFAKTCGVVPTHMPVQWVSRTPLSVV